jgi:DNA-binding NarL/FixJ family response regulator
MFVALTCETGRQGLADEARTKAFVKEVMAMTAPRVLLADDQEEMLEALVEMLKGDFQIVGTAENGMRVLELTPRLTPDIVVLDISMPAVNGIEAASRLREECSWVRVIFLTVHQDADFVVAAMSTGALGYVLKSCLATDLVPAIWKALEGRTFISPSIRLA